jgi:hypothetical protein
VTTDGDYIISSDGKTITVLDSRKTADITVSKQELTLDDEGNKTGKAIPANEDGTENKAKFKLTPKTSGDSLVGMTIGGKTLTQDDLENDGSYIFEGNNTEMKGLKENNRYALEETVAPDGYELVTTTFTFTVKDGKVSLEGVTTDGDYIISPDGKTITVLDSRKTADITVSKQELVESEDGKKDRQRNSCKAER